MRVFNDVHNEPSQGRKSPQCTWRGYSYIRVQTVKTSISKEINCAECKYINMSSPPAQLSSVCAGTILKDLNLLRLKLNQT